jgi:membrane protease YdiL (CAAX protease family)
LSGPTPTNSNGHNPDLPTPTPPAGDDRRPDSADPVEGRDLPAVLEAPDEIDADAHDLTPAGTHEPSGLVGPSGRRPIGGTVFSLEGRAAPGLYLVGWIATVLGLAILAAVLTAGAGGGGTAILLIVALILLSVGLVSAAGAQGMDRRAHAPGHVDPAATIRHDPPSHAIPAYAGPSPFLVFAASVPLTLLLTIVVLAPLSALGLKSGGPAAVAVQEIALLLVNVGLLRLLVVSPGALTWTDMGLRIRSFWRVLADLLIGAVLAIPVWLATLVAVAIAISFINHQPDNPLPPSSDATSFGLNLLTAAVLAPIAEELFFRGFATTAWVSTMGAERGLIRGALFFAFVHVFNASGVTFGDALAEAAVGFIARVPVGFALGWIFLQRRSLYASIGMHSSFNAIQVVLSYLVRAT